MNEKNEEIGYSSDEESSDGEHLESFVSQRLTEVHYDDALERLERSMNLKKGTLAAEKGALSIQAETMFNKGSRKGSEAPSTTTPAKESLPVAEVEEEEEEEEYEEPAAESLTLYKNLENGCRINHLSILQQQLKALLSDSLFSDTEIFVGPKKEMFTAHSLILTTRSVALKKMFHISMNNGSNSGRSSTPSRASTPSRRSSTPSSMSKKRKSVAGVDDAISSKTQSVTRYWNADRKMKIYRWNVVEGTRSTFKEFLTYLYTGVLSLTKKNAIKILEYARRYQMQQLRVKCIDFISQNVITEDNCITLLKDPQLGSDPLFLTEAVSMIAKNYIDEDPKKKPQPLNGDTMTLFLQNKIFSKLTEIETFQFLLAWAKRQVNDHRTLDMILKPYLSFINLNAIKLIDLYKIVKPSGVIQLADYMKAVEHNIDISFVQCKIILKPAKASVRLALPILRPKIPIVVSRSKTIYKSEASASILPSAAISKWIFQQDGRIVLAYNPNFCLTVVEYEMASEEKDGDAPVVFRFELNLCQPKLKTRQLFKYDDDHQTIRWQYDPLYQLDYVTPEDHTSDKFLILQRKGETKKSKKSWILQQ
mmetsp:Transcript_2501/g.3625  ORF Transcript_2501/g.3625 Transcript_2501/m.3625 type:complete len:592 (-) Transcript_2501:28-1803(-)